MEWSPFYVLPKAELTPSGLLQLDTNDHEVELIRRSPVEIRYEADEPMTTLNSSSSSSSSKPPKGCTIQDWTNRSTNLTLIVTTHRIVWSDINNDHRFIHFSNVHSSHGMGGPSFQHPRATYKIQFQTFTYASEL